MIGEISELHPGKVKTGDEPIVRYLRNFFRNDSVWGLWDKRNYPFVYFLNMSSLDVALKNRIMSAHHHAWKEAFPSLDSSDLEAPRIGNPWGYIFQGHLVYEPAFEYNFQAHYIDHLLYEKDSPMILEIGGGFGGLAYHLLKNLKRPVKYIGLDLPEKMLLQSYYLSCSFPELRLFSYDGMGWPDNPDDYDVILLPNFLLNKVPDMYADMLVNFRSLSEMSYETISEYLKQFDRIGRLFFYHKNIHRKRKEDTHGIPSMDFPRLRTFTEVYSCESRWLKYGADSVYPFHENLFVKKGRLT